MAQDLLLEIGVEELPASFVTGALEALPGLLQAGLRDLRLRHGGIRVLGTPRRLAAIVGGVEEAQPDLDETVLGPPARVAFDANGNLTRAAQAFASKLGVDPYTLSRVTTDKGEYLCGHRREKGARAFELLPALLENVCKAIPFRKSMRWSDGEQTFGRPVRWLVALFGVEAVPFTFAGLVSRPETCGHRFLAPGAIPLHTPADYVPRLRAARVIVDTEEREKLMIQRLEQAAASVGGKLIPDEFLVSENACLVEEPYVVVGDFEARFLVLPESVILAVAKGHQRYFGVRGADGKLLPKYLAVVGTAENPENIRRGNNNVMRARLADAKFFWDEDLKVPLGSRRKELDGIVFHKRLGTIGDKVRRIERLVGELAALFNVPEQALSAALEGARLCKCDLVTLMVRELPELQGTMGEAYARVQGASAHVAAVITEHYQPRGTDDSTAPSDAGALVALADRLDTLAGCFAVGLAPTGAADPLALRRAAIGTLRTLIQKQWRTSLTEAVRRAYGGFSEVTLDLDLNATLDKLGEFFTGRLRGLLPEPGDVVDACIASSADDPYDVALRARALAQIDENVRASAGEVFKRAANIAKDAPQGLPEPPERVSSDVHPSERKLFDAFQSLKAKLNNNAEKPDYASVLNAIAEFAPILGRFFDDVFVMVEERALRDNRLRLMRDIHQSCSKFANFNLLVGK